MKVRSREINIISMSALDMFCSALGAFMFLALLFLPFAGNLGPKNEEVQKIIQQNQQLKQQLQEAKAQRDAAQEELRRGIQQRATDVAIVIDTTGSMQGPIDGLKSQIVDFARILNKLSDRARIAIVAYNDRCVGPSLMVRVQPLTLVKDAGLAQLQAFAGSLRAQSIAPGQTEPCNPDVEEEVYTGIVRARDLAWSADARNRFIVVIGDQPAHPEEVASSQAVARAWGQTGAHLSTLQVGTEPAATRFYGDLARNGNGTAMANGGTFALSVLIAMTQ